MYDRIFSIFCTLLFVFLVSEVSSAENVRHHHDIKWQEKLLKKHLPDSMPYQTKEDILRMVKWKNNKKALDYAQIVSKIYQKNVISEVKDEEDYALLSTCDKHIAKLTLDLDSGQPYAQYVADSNGNLPSGVLRGDYLWLGKYYECKGQTDGNELVTKMCLVILGEKTNSTDGLYLGTCVPESCDEKSVSAWMELFAQGSYATTFCPDAKPYTNADIAAICVFSILAFFVLVGTICETTFICLDIYYGEENPAHEARKRSVPAYLLLCFSLIKNTKTLMNTKRKESNIAVLDGIRVLSMAWVILGHTIYFSFWNIGNHVDVMKFSITHPGGQAIINGTFSVDSFFFLSGLLVTYLTLREMRRSGSLNIPIMYLHRYLRLTPTLVLVMLFASTLFLRSAEEPFFEVRNSYISDFCEKYWWANVLYINNLYPKSFEEGCISWVWYLANDWQFFLISPFFIYLLYKFPKYGLAVMGVALVGNLAITGGLASHYDIYPDVLTYSFWARVIIIANAPQQPDAAKMTIYNGEETTAFDYTTSPPATTDDPDYFADIYAKPWCRIGAYLIGMLAGYILYVTNKKIKLKLIFIIQLWVATFALGLTLIYGWWGDVKTIDVNDLPGVDLRAFYETMKRPLWALCLMWLTIGCSIGYGGPINTILSWKVFIPLSRLTFCAYLVHPLVLFYMFSARETEAFLRVNIYSYYYVAAFVLSYAAAYVLSMLVEAPMAGLQKIIFYTPEDPFHRRNQTYN